MSCETDLIGVDPQDCGFITPPFFVLFSQKKSVNLRIVNLFGITRRVELFDPVRTYCVIYTRMLCLRMLRLGGESGTKELFTELVRREELLFTMVSGIRLDLDKVKDMMRNIDDILTRILRVEEKEFVTQEDAR